MKTLTDQKLTQYPGKALEKRSDDTYRVVCLQGYNLNLLKHLIKQLKSTETTNHVTANGRHELCHDLEDAPVTKGVKVKTLIYFCCWPAICPFFSSLLYMILEYLTFGLRYIYI
jgi:hypothetical protein